MRTIDRHLFLKASKMVAGLVLLALCILLLERSLRIIEITSMSLAPFRDATRMMLNLIPHYLGLAFPAALMIGTIVTVSALSKVEEITALMASGLSLTRISRPFLLLGFLMASGALIVEGYLQPYARYSYREAVHVAQQETIVGAFQRGEFVSDAGRTSFVRNVGDQGEITGVFIYDRAEDGSIRVLTAPNGLIVVDQDTRQTELLLAGGSSVWADRENGVTRSVAFEQAAAGTSGSVEAFRPRGDDDRELTLGELLGGVLRDRLPDETHDDAATAFHFRVGRAVAILFFPLMAIPLGLVSSRSNQSGGVAVGLLYIVVIQKLFEAGQGAAANGAIAPWLGVWPVVGLVIVTSTAVFVRSAYTLASPPMEALSQGIQLPRFKPFARPRIKSG